MSSFKNTDLQKDFAAGVYLSEAQTPITPSPYTAYVYTLDLFTREGGGGGGNWTREKGKGATG